MWFAILSAIFSGSEEEDETSSSVKTDESEENEENNKSEGNYTTGSAGSEQRRHATREATKQILKSFAFGCCLCPLLLLIFWVCLRFCPVGDLVGGLYIPSYSGYGNYFYSGYRDMMNCCCLSDIFVDVFFAMKEFLGGILVVPSIFLCDLASECCIGCSNITIRGSDALLIDANGGRQPPASDVAEPYSDLTNYRYEYKHVSFTQNVTQNMLNQIAPTTISEVIVNAVNTLRRV